MGSLRPPHPWEPRYTVETKCRNPLIIFRSYSVSPGPSRTPLSQGPQLRIDHAHFATRTRQCLGLLPEETAAHVVRRSRIPRRDNQDVHTRFTHAEYLVGN